MKNNEAKGALVLGAALAPAALLAGFDVLDLRPHKAGAEAGLEARRAAWDTLEAASALQGLVNRKSPRLYLLLVGEDAKYDRFWLDRLRSTWLKGEPQLQTTDLMTVIEKHKSVVKGLAVWDERIPATSNVAATLAGVENLLPVRHDPSPGSLHTRLSRMFPEKRRLIRPDGSPLFDGSVTGSPKTDAYRWAADQLLQPGKANPRLIGYYPDAAWLKTPRDVPWERTLLSNRDYFIARKAFFLDVSPWLDEAPNDDPTQRPGTDGHMLREILGRCVGLAGGKFIHVGGFTPWDQKYTAFTGQKHGDVETEWHFAEVLSCFNAYMDADAAGLHAMANASFFAHERIPRRTTQKRPTEADLVQKGFLDSGGKPVPKRYIAIYAGDYDSAAWLYQSLPDKWTDPARGRVPLGWAFNPIHEGRFPTGLNYARQTATPLDAFISGNSGAAYVNPGLLDDLRTWSLLPSGLAEWEEFNRGLFRRWDLDIVGFVIDGFAPPMNQRTKEAYARFALAGVVAQKVPYLSHVQGTPFLRMGLDLNRHRTEESIGRVNQIVPREGLHFAIFRTILWTPSDHEEFFKALKLARPDIEIVDPHTLFMLARKSGLAIP